MAKYLFEDIILKSSKCIGYEDKSHVMFATKKLLQAIASKWYCRELCNNIRSRNTANLFNNREHNVQPMLLNDVKIFKNGDIVLNDIIYRTTCYENDTITILDNDIKTTKYENAICLSGKWSDAIYHFPFDYLCGLRTINYTGQYVHVKKNKYTLQWLDLCGIAPNNIIDGDIHVENALVPYLPVCGNPTVSDILWLKSIVDKHIIKNNKDKIILVKRNNFRRLANYQELENNVKIYADKMKLKLVIHDDNDLPDLKSQLQYFSEAKLVITPHGGSEINLLACDKFTNVISFMDIDYTNTCFMRIAYY